MRGPKFDDQGRLLLSFSASDRFRRCGLEFLFAIENPRPPTTRMIIGGAFDRASKEVLRLYQEHGQVPPLDEVADRAREAAQDKWAAGVYFVDDEESKARQVKGEVTDKAVAAAVLYARSHVPTLRPKTVDRWIRYQIDRGEGRKPVMLRGEIDLEEEDGTIRDLKWRAKSPVWHEAATSVQLSLYAAEAMLTAPKGDPRKEEVRVARDVYVDKSSPEIVPQEATRNAAQIESAVAVVRGVADALDKGVFLPARPFEDWWCSPKHCRWWSDCPISKPFRHLEKPDSAAAKKKLAAAGKKPAKVARLRGRKVVIR